MQDVFQIAGTDPLMFRRKVSLGLHCCCRLYHKLYVVQPANKAAVDSALEQSGQREKLPRPLLGAQALVSHPPPALQCRRLRLGGDARLYKIIDELTGGLGVHHRVTLEADLRQHAVGNIQVEIDSGYTRTERPEQAFDFQPGALPSDG